jgi:hypothetical protein
VVEHPLDSLTGVQPATLQRYRSYLSRDVTFRSLPITAVTESTISKWVTALKVLAISRLKRWSIRYYNDTATKLTPPTSVDMRMRSGALIGLPESLEQTNP